MEIKLNKEIRKFNESVVAGLTLRQTVFGVLALAAAVAVFFLLNDKLHTEIVSWLSMIAAIPFAAIGFIQYHGMPLERMIAAWIKYTFFTSKKLYFKPENLYKQSATQYLEQKRKDK